MNDNHRQTRSMRVLRNALLPGVGVVCFGVMLAAQKNAVQPQPQADKLPAPGSASPNFGQTVPRPEGANPTVPAGFSVSVFADNIQAPRMMVYAPNGDLFVSQTAANSITILRDTNKDGIPDTRSVYVQGAAVGRGGGGGAGGGGGGRGAPGAGRGGAPGAAPAGAPGAPPAGGAPGAGRGPAPGAASGGGAPAPRGGAPGAAGGGAPAVAQRGGGGAPGGGGGRGGAQVFGANAPACTPPSDPQPSTGALRQPFGLAFNNGYLYVANTDAVVRYRYSPGDTQPQGEPQKIVDLPGGGNHFTRNIVFNRAGTKMYVAVGSASNNNPAEDCRRAAILEFNPDGTGYRIYASGIRNPVGLALQPGTDIVWTAINERDGLGDDLVPDYATSVKEGGFYGWPYSYIGKNYDPRFVGSFPDLVNKAIVPDVLIPSHSAALGITFYTGTQFPQRYRNGGFVALHGSWNRSTAAGYKVVFFPMNNGRPGPLEDFLTGFLVGDGSDKMPIQAWGRPVGVTVAPDGALLVSDDGGNRIWRISATTK